MVQRFLAGAAATVVTLVAVTSTAAAEDVPFKGKPWPRGKVTYYDATPASYRFSVQAAVAHWNGVGAKVSFVRTSSRRRAGLVLREDRRQRSAGRATLGYVAGHQSLATFNKAFGTKRDKYVTTMLVVHELGHVLGLEHPRSRTRCAVLNPRFFQACAFDGVTPQTWVCGLVQPADLRPLQRRYGRRAARKQPRYCPRGTNPGTPVAPTDTTGTGSWVEDRTAAGDVYRKAVVDLRWTPLVPSSRTEAIIERLDVPCVEATAERWARDASFVLRPDDRTTIDPATGSVRDVGGSAADPAAGEQRCYRWRVSTVNDEGASNVAFGVPDTLSAPIDVVVPPDPAPLPPA
jgi:hypothetical protein